MINDSIVMLLRGQVARVRKQIEAGEELDGGEFAEQHMDDLADECWALHFAVWRRWPTPAPSENHDKQHEKEPVDGP